MPAKTATKTPAAKPRSGKKLVKKATPKAAPKTSKAAPKAKAKAAPKTSSRKVNSRPVLSETTGMNISPAKVKNVVSNLVLNRQQCDALDELRDAQPRKITRTVEGKETTEDFKGTPLAKLSQATRDYVAFAASEYERGQREEYARKKVAGMDDTAHGKYVAARNKAKATHDAAQENVFLSSSGSSFDYEAFNRSYDKNFYNAFKSAADDGNAWDVAIARVSKLKSRFSTNARVFLSAFAERLVQQLALNGTVCCVADGKKIIQLSHVLNTSQEGFAERFPLFPLIVNLSTFRQAQAHLAAQAAKASAPAEESKDGDAARQAPETDLFNIEGVSLERQYQFRYYIAETCRETRMNLAKTAKDAEGNLMEVYNHTSVSKVFKNFCSSLVCEFLMRIGQMLNTEIATRGIKTVNDTIIGATISHYHTVCGVDSAATLDFIRSTATKYYASVADRQQRRKDGTSGGDMAYVEETA